MTGKLFKAGLTVGVIMAVVVTAVVLAGPLLVLWAANTLFALGIPVTVKTWFATLLLMVVFGGAGRAGGKS